MSNLVHPYRFHVGASWAGKPPDARPAADKAAFKPFPKDSLIGQWRDRTLSRPKSVASTNAGEDFLFVQEVCRDLLPAFPGFLFHSIDNFDQMRSQSVGTHLTPGWKVILHYLTIQGVALGVADGVGGWVESGVDPSLFSQALMYHSHRYSRSAWPGEPEIDPTQDYQEREQVEGWELTPHECLDLAYGGVLRERFVQAGQ
jgi:protein phosphatase PTC7